MKKPLFSLLLCFLSALCLWCAQIRRDQLALAHRIAPQILRFHVIANSNSAKDQEIKLKVKSYLLEHIYEQLYTQTDSTPQASPSLQTPSEKSFTKEDIKSFLLTHKEELEHDTESYIRQLGVSCPVSFNLTWCEFPEKTYGSLRLPAGTYEAAQLKIGAARGHNWWCVLYPKICITKDAVAAIPDSSLEELRQLLSPEDFQKLLLQRPAFTPKIRFSFYALDKLKPQKQVQDSAVPAGSVTAPSSAPGR